ncbi:MAG: ChrR family anti-sigma-E factor [Beijerinckiaceae bacterium]
MPISRGHAAAADALFASYAAGALSRPLHALVASHLSLSPDNRAYVAALEAIAADNMAHEEPLTNVADRGRRLAAIFGDRAEPNQEEGHNPLVPAPLAAYLGKPLDALKWRSVLPGLKEVKLEDRNGCEASLLWIKAGRAMPAHTHPGIEATLVLQGSFTDAMGHYERGDIAVADSDVDHKPVAGHGDDCICFAVSEGPVKLTGPVARLFNKLIRH